MTETAKRIRAVLTEIAAEQRARQLAPKVVTHRKEWTTAAEKTCRACDVRLPASEFYSDKKMSDGLSSYCKPCTRAKKRAYGFRNAEKKRAYHQSPAHRLNPKRIATCREYDARRRVEHKDKLLARARLNQAIKRGEIVRPPCPCGNPKAQGHHHDYSKPYDVEWLCAVCHGKTHRRSPEGLAAL